MSTPSKFRKTCRALVLISAFILLAIYFGIILFKDTFVEFALLELSHNVILGSLAGLIVMCVLAALLLMVTPKAHQTVKDELN